MQSEVHYRCVYGSSSRLVWPSHSPQGLAGGQWSDLVSSCLPQTLRTFPYIKSLVKGARGSSESTLNNVEVFSMHGKLMPQYGFEEDICICIKALGKESALIGTQKGISHQYFCHLWHQIMAGLMLCFVARLEIVVSK